MKTAKAPASYFILLLDFGTWICRKEALRSQNWGGKPPLLALAGFPLKNPSLLKTSHPLLDTAAHKWKQTTKPNRSEDYRFLVLSPVSRRPWILCTHIPWSLLTAPFEIAAATTKPVRNAIFTCNSAVSQNYVSQACGCKLTDSFFQEHQ